MSPVRCDACVNWSIRDTDQALARHGLAICKVRSVGKHQTFSGPYERICSDFRQAPPETITARENFAASKPAAETPGTTKGVA
jgi:hypothetical protein